MTYNQHRKKLRKPQSQKQQGQWRRLINGGIVEMGGTINPGRPAPYLPENMEKLPDECKILWIHSFHKKGDKQDVNSYRGASLSSQSSTKSSSEQNRLDPRYITQGVPTWVPEWPLLCYANPQFEINDLAQSAEWQKIMVSFIDFKKVLIQWTEKP